MPTRTREALLASVREFVATEVIPSAPAHEHADAYPHRLVARMREQGLFGALVPLEYGGLGLDVTTYARVIEEICRGFMSLAGVINSLGSRHPKMTATAGDGQERRSRNALATMTPAPSARKSPRSLTSSANGVNSTWTPRSA